MSCLDISGGILLKSTRILKDILCLKVEAFTNILGHLLRYNSEFLLECGSSNTISLIKQVINSFKPSFSFSDQPTYKRTQKKI